jgi:glycosyltransferase involved in cell wall biosynthesis
MSKYPHLPIIAYIPALDEESDIEGACRNALQVCNQSDDDVYVLLDSRSKDRTREIVEQFPQIKIYLQDQTLGGSTRHNRGSDEITFIHNINEFLKTTVPEGQWVMVMAGDERYDPRDVEKIRFYVDQAENLNLTALVFEIADVFPDEQHRVAYESVPGLILAHIRFFKYHEDFGFGTRAHDDVGDTGTRIRARTGLWFYHFGNLKRTADWNWWREWDGINLTKKYVLLDNPFIDWKKGI